MAFAFLFSWMTAKEKRSFTLGLIAALFFVLFSVSAQAQSVDGNGNLEGLHNDVLSIFKKVAETYAAKTPELGSEKDHPLAANDEGGAGLHSSRLAHPSSHQESLPRLVLSSPH